MIIQSPSLQGKYIHWSDAQVEKTTTLKTSALHALQNAQLIVSSTLLDVSTTQLAFNLISLSRLQLDQQKLDLVFSLLSMEIHSRIY